MIKKQPCIDESILPDTRLSIATLGSILDSKRSINLAQLVSASVVLLAELVTQHTSEWVDIFTS